MTTSAFSLSQINAKPAKIGVIDRTQKTYFAFFILAILVSWSPNKIAPYLMPLVFIPLSILLIRSKTVIRNTIILGLAWIAWIGVSAVLNPDFIFQNALLSIVTYCAFYPILVIPTRYLASDQLYVKIAKILLIVVAFQSVIGAFQVAYGFSVRGSFDVNTGDHIEGTIDLPLQQKTGFETPMFAINIALALIVLIPYVLAQRRLWSIIIFLFGTFIFVLSSVVHVLIMFLIALGVSFILYRPVQISSKKLALAAFFILCLIPLILFMMYRLLPTNLSRLPVQFERVVRQENPKVVLLYRLFEEVPDEYPYLPLVGIGPGQFASRASLIASGYYLGGLNNPTPLPLLEATVSHALDRYVMDLWYQLRNWPGSAGSTLRPFSSWLSIYSEFGFLGGFLVVMIVLGLLYKSLTHTKSKNQKIFGFAFGSGVILIFLLGLQENYWETPQAILIGCMALKVLYSLILYSNTGFQPN